MIHICKCNKCGGTGQIWIYAHVSGGTCFNCNGKGTLNTDPQKRRNKPVYSDEVLDKLRAESEKREEQIAELRKRWYQIALDVLQDKKKRRLFLEALIGKEQMEIDEMLKRNCSDEELKEKAYELLNDEGIRDCMTA